MKHLSRHVENYIKYRPHYPAAIIDLLRKECHLNSQHVIADTGSGTGILAKIFLENGNPFFGTEPDPDMRAGADYYLRDFPQFRQIDGTAESTTLPDHGVDLVTAGQSFHWFNIKQARKEFAR